MSLTTISFSAGENQRGWGTSKQRQMAAQIAGMLTEAPDSARAAILDSVHTRLLPEEPSLLLCKEVVKRATSLLKTLDGKGAVDTTEHFSSVKTASILGTLPDKDTGHTHVRIATRMWGLQKVVCAD